MDVFERYRVIVFGLGLVAGVGSPLPFPTAAIAAEGPVVTAEAGALRVRLTDGTIVEDKGIIGARLTLRIGSTLLKVRIADVEADVPPLYDLRLVAPNGSEGPLCAPDPHGIARAIALPGVADRAGILRMADQRGLELFCTASPQGKCARMGYLPWKHAPEGRQLLHWFNACVRLLRADYCGDGGAHTRNGTLVDIYDRIGILSSDNDPTLAFEAHWGPDGAICVARTRVPELLDLAGLGGLCPRRSHPCPADDTAALLVNRSRP